MSSWNVFADAQAGPGFWERFAGIAAPAAAIYGASMPGASRVLFPLGRRLLELLLNHLLHAAVGDAVLASIRTLLRRQSNFLGEFLDRCVRVRRVGGLAEIAVVMNLSRVRVRSLKDSALKKLKRPTREAGWSEPLVKNTLDSAHWKLGRAARR